MKYLLNPSSSFQELPTFIRNIPPDRIIVELQYNRLQGISGRKNTLAEDHYKANNWMDGLERWQQRGRKGKEANNFIICADLSEDDGERMHKISEAKWCGSALVHQNCEVMSLSRDYERFKEFGKNRFD